MIMSYKQLVYMLQLDGTSTSTAAIDALAELKRENKRMREDLDDMAFKYLIAVKANPVVPDDFLELLDCAMAEAETAMAKFPQPNYVISKFAEESGEVVKAAIHHAEGRETRDAVVGEMRQCLAMMLRMWIEGDKVHGLPAIGVKGQHNDTI